MPDPVYDLPCPECGKISRKTLVQLATVPRLPCDHCPVSIRVADHYGQAELDALAQSEGRIGSIIRDLKKDK